MGGGFMTFWSSSIVYCVLLPVFVLSHELGHAAVYLVRSDAPVSVGLGGSGRWHVQLGRLQLMVGPNFWSYRKPAGTVAWLPLDKWSNVACGLAGPLAQACASALLIPIGVWSHQPLVGDAGVVGAGIALTSLLPFRLPGFGSDGARVLRALRGKETLAEARARWKALMGDPKRTLGPERGRVVNAVPILVDQPGAGPDALGVWKLAFAGFCWRAVSGDAWTSMRDAALEALHEAAQAWAGEPDLTIAATQTLARRESHEGLEHMPVSLRAISVDEAKQRWAFQFGVALYDVEMARNASSTS